LNQHSLPPLDITVAARPAAREAALPALRASLDKLLVALARRS
jgi:hypothetical protein